MIPHPGCFQQHCTSIKGGENMRTYETADMNKNTSSMRALVEEMRKIPEGTTIQNDYVAGTQTIVYKDGHKAIRSINGSKVKPSVKRSASSELVASLKKTMREADENKSDFIRRIAQLDAEIDSKTMRGQYTGHLKHQRDDLLQRINQLEAIKGRCAALLGGV